MRYRPSHRVSKRISAVLLRAMERGDLPEAGYLERSACVEVLTSFRLAPGQKVVMGKLWQKFGAEVPRTLLSPGRVEDDEMVQALAG